MSVRLLAPPCTTVFECVRRAMSSLTQEAPFVRPNGAPYD